MISKYRVTGARRYREHKPGATFEANLDPAAEQRAVDRGDIELIERLQTGLREGSYRLPAGWPPEASKGDRR